MPQGPVARGGERRGRDGGEGGTLPESCWQEADYQLTKGPHLYILVSLRRCVNLLVSIK